MRSLWKSPSNSSPFDSLILPLPSFVSFISIPSQYSQQSSSMSKLLQSNASPSLTGLSLQTFPKPLNSSCDQLPSQASFPPSQYSLPNPSILLFRHCPSQYPPSWQQNFPRPFRIPSDLNPSQRLPVSYSSTTYSSSSGYSDLQEWSGESQSRTSTMVELYLFLVVGRFGVSAFSYYCQDFSSATMASVRSAAGRIMGDSLFSSLLSASLSTAVSRFYLSSDLVLVGLSGCVTWLQVRPFSADTRLLKLSQKVKLSLQVPRIGLTGVGCWALGMVEMGMVGRDCSRDWQMMGTEVGAGVGVGGGALKVMGLVKEGQLGQKWILFSLLGVAGWLELQMFLPWSQVQAGRKSLKLRGPLGNGRVLLLLELLMTGMLMMGFCSAGPTACGCISEYCMLNLLDSGQQMLVVGLSLLKLIVGAWLCTQSESVCLGGCQTGGRGSVWMVWVDAVYFLRVSAKSKAWCFPLSLLSLLMSLVSLLSLPTISLSPVLMGVKKCSSRFSMPQIWKILFLSAGLASSRHSKPLLSFSSLKSLTLLRTSSQLISLLRWQMLSAKSRRLSSRAMTPTLNKLAWNSLQSSCREEKAALSFSGEGQVSSSCVILSACSLSPPPPPSHGSLSVILQVFWSMLKLSRERRSQSRWKRWLYSLSPQRQVSTTCWISFSRKAVWQNLRLATSSRKEQLFCPWKMRQKFCSSEQQPVRSRWQWPRRREMASQRVRAYSSTVWVTLAASEGEFVVILWSVQRSLVRRCSRQGCDYNWYSSCSDADSDSSPADRQPPITYEIQINRIPRTPHHRPSPTPPSTLTCKLHHFFFPPFLALSSFFTENTSSAPTMAASSSAVLTGNPSWVRASTSSSSPPVATVQRQQTPLSERKELASCSSLVLMNLRSPVLSTSSTQTCSLATFCRTSSSLFFRSPSFVFFSAYFWMAVLENSMAFSRSIFSCSSGEDATGASLPPFFAPFLSSFCVGAPLPSSPRPGLPPPTSAWPPLSTTSSRLPRSLRCGTMTPWRRESPWRCRYLGVLCGKPPKCNRRQPLPGSQS